MQAYILESERRIAPFDEPPGAMRIHNRSLRETQERLLKALGCQVAVIGDLEAIGAKPCLLVRDDVYFTYHALAGFLKMVRRLRGEAQPRSAGDGPRRKNWRAALACSMLTEYFSPTFQGRPISGPGDNAYRAYDLYYFEDYDPGVALEDQAELAPIPHRVAVRRWRVNRYFDPSGSASLPMSLVALCPIQHWAALVTANLLGLPSQLLQTAKANPWATLTLPLRTVLRAGSLRPAYLRGKLYWAGRGSKVHPSAHVESSVLGRNVRIGPGAVVRGAVLADRVEIGPNAIVECTSLGEKATVNGGVTLRSCVVGQEANVGAYFTQLSVIGRGAALCPSSGTFDFNLRGNVAVGFQGRTISSGSRTLGSCLGHGAFLGAEVTLASGQELPNGCILVRNPRDVVGDLAQGLPPGVLRLDRGRRSPRVAGDSDAGAQGAS
jgi:carbonic anhydrase/acetyltransferase-like protein (isoleucine patch superfamily)